MPELAAPWRWGRAFSPLEIAQRLQALEQEESPVPRSGASDAGLEHYHSQALIAREAPGAPKPGGAFERACELSARYEFSDPRIVIGHFDAQRPLLGRPLLLELRTAGLHILAGVRISEVQKRIEHEDWSVFTWRYDTLPGHIEFGSEWFRVLQRHSSGEVRGELKNGGNIAAAKAVGKAIAERAKTAGVTKVCFDRAGRMYHGRIKALADAAREGGLQF